MFVGLEPVTVELTLFTDSLVVTGRVTTPHRRVTDILNLAEGPFLVLDQVTVDEHGTRGQMSSLPVAQVNLDTILFAIADSVIEPNPTTGGVKPAAALISVPPFSVAGNVHLLGDGDARAALAGHIRSIEVAKSLEAAKQLVHGLFAHPGAIGEHAGANAVRARKLQHRHVRQAQVVEACGVELRDEPSLNGLGRHAQQRSDEHVLRRDRAVGGTDS